MLIELLRNDGILQVITENDFDRYISEFLFCKLNSSFFTIRNFDENIINTVPCSFYLDLKEHCVHMEIRFCGNNNIRTAFILWCQNWNTFGDFTFFEASAMLELGVDYASI